ncbi:hypothetical protein DYB37_000854 [Aphanomyces astaci]|uniref:Uncharacterized protein n=1 Tax=Aphanomyces astaci TaxID=112090 RepID=A0A397F8Q9_APHAT|nr:hypothetical protein DYB25_011125 [Aphanomyces astaci]RHY41942.1 hypothetical protein DYB38_008127 [Aphanomyces astaci]RHY56581.1 hypothetical protein DYB30_008389 [Aphanomyces astaci]RHY73788.1 hypothetical protein DYB34_008001 [Aphanomyces astaci]RHY83060.1 hypothetical protein DYB35_000715 [Aphanomyces astaci]
MKSDAVGVTSIVLIAVAAGVLLVVAIVVYRRHRRKAKYAPKTRPPLPSAHFVSSSTPFSNALARPSGVLSPWSDEDDDDDAALFKEMVRIRVHVT